MALRECVAYMNHTGLVWRCAPDQAIRNAVWETLSDAMASIDDIIEDFALIDDWEDRYRYVIELGRSLEPYPESARDDTHKVRGCASQVWLETTETADAGEGKRLQFRGDSDAHIVRGLIYILLTLYSGKSAKDILATDALETFAKLGLTEHLTPQRSNGVRAMVERIKADARAALSAA
jgi:cysteine desulfuration protein SufE